MALELRFLRVPDPSGHGAGLRLRGDWVFLLVSDGLHTGLGEASHSGDDRRCLRAAERIFAHIATGLAPSLEEIRTLESGVLSTAADRIEATAASALDQALTDLCARKQGLPVWALFRDRPVRQTVSCYTTLNRALHTRTEADYLDLTAMAVDRGLQAVKCAPFEAVVPGTDQPRAASVGLRILERLRDRFPALNLRVDCHARFEPPSFLAVLPALRPLALHWIEEPCPVGDGYRQLRREAGVPLAAGELHFRWEGFAALVERGLVDVIMPDVKHVGGFGPLLEVSQRAAAAGVQTSPHNPSGPVSTLASVHAAAVSPEITAVELCFFRDPGRLFYGPYLVEGALRIPEGPGWGIDAAMLEDMARRTA